jgi:hypothetical protein
LEEVVMRGSPRGASEGGEPISRREASAVATVREEAGFVAVGAEPSVPDIHDAGLLEAQAIGPRQVQVITTSLLRLHRLGESGLERAGLVADAIRAVQVRDVDPA